MSQNNFILQFKLKTEVWQNDIIDKRLESGRKIYNSLVSKSLKQLYELQKTQKYRNLLSQLTGNKEADASIWREINSLRKEAGFSEYGFSRMVTPMRIPFKKHIGTHIAQKISKRIWESYEKFFYGNGEEIHFKKFGQINSLEGKNNTTGIIFDKDKRICKWSGLTIPVIVDDKNSYEVESLDHPIAYCRIVKQIVRSKRKYYLQVVFKGQKPAKRHNSDGSFVHVLGRGDVGIDIGTSTVAYASDGDVKVRELADKAQGMEREKWLLKRKLDRSRRSTNPDNYNPDGTAKKGRMKWVRSKRYMKILFALKEIYRKQKDVRKLQHEILANEVLRLGDNFYVETMNFQALQKRAKETQKNDKGKFKRKKRFGKPLANRAPSMFLTILNRKLGYFGKELVKINTWKARASQFNHIEETFEKKALFKRWNIIEGTKVQRDMYSAFLIMNINPDLESFDLTKCKNRYDKFLVLHNKEVKRIESLKQNGKQILSCIGI